MSETNKAQSNGAAQPGLTAADLDRLAAIHPGLADSLARLRRARLCGYVGDRCDCKYTGAAEMCRAPDHRSETGGGCPEVRTAEGIVRALPSLLALARRGLEAEQSAPFKADMDTLHGLLDDFAEAAADRVRSETIEEVDEAKARQEATRTACMRVLVRASDVRDTESKLAAALAELATLKAERDASEPSKADRCVNCAFGARACRQCRDRIALAAALAEVERVRGRLEKATRFLWPDAEGEPEVYRDMNGVWWHVDGCPENEPEPFDTLDAAWSAAEAQSARPAAPKGGPG